MNWLSCEIQSYAGMTLEENGIRFALMDGRQKTSRKFFDEDQSVV
jgi:hypothetical protein